MTADLPEPSLVLEAIEAYLRAAYDGSPPPAVAERVDALRRAEPGAFFANPAFERVGEGAGQRFNVRLGNRHYPHMKLVLEPRPDREGYLFRADSHDRHAAPPPGSRDHAAFQELMTQNQSVVTSIEKTWQERGIPTFKSWLRDDLARRRRQQTLDDPAGS